MRCLLSTVLHPGMRTKWFAKPVAPRAGSQPNSKEHKAAQAANIARVEVIVQEIANQYLEDSEKQQEPTSQQPPPASASKSLGGHDSLIDMFDVDVEVPAAGAPQSPQEQLKSELKRYFAFEGGKGDPGNPLGWWKVRRCFPFCDLSTDSPSSRSSTQRTSQRFRKWLAISLRFQRPVSQ
jgi:hypothetical protein